MTTQSTNSPDELERIVALEENKPIVTEVKSPEYLKGVAQTIEAGLFVC